VLSYQHNFKCILAGCRPAKQAKQVKDEALEIGGQVE
jgi:hypothetical protein